MIKFDVGDRVVYRTPTLEYFGIVKKILDPETCMFDVEVDVESKGGIWFRTQELSLLCTCNTLGCRGGCYDK